ncbi:MULTISPECIES: GMC family oxidoreductase [unclassified Mesorhizobium]|uniref:GMC family oxidoreductase n=1 Tax=unclassified Mesorhizobium TaxID=325217 RepID=UPI000964F1C0|nr:MULTISPECIES: GMC family oxidoreductase [unclassified Mesorhizobium]MBN9253575.1 GMC family oxidoreductase [Mesorhizobium sp.]OJX82009.1 MAG: gluconate 5-dehydrogenase [Mesorhizobium sp. 65-26]
MAYSTKPDRTDVVIIGAGASGAAAAKVLCEAGMKVVALEKGPWRRKESFGGDELANINRYNLWPDPMLNPRTWRETAADKARLEMFCPVPQMVGGGTVHWQGWLPRFTPNDFRLRTVAGELAGTSLADWPVSYDEIEPYYLKVEWAFGVSGEAGANRFEGPRSGGYPCPPMPMSRYAQKFHQGCSALGWNSFPTPQAALSRPFGGRKATVVSAFAQQHGDPTGTRSSALNVFIPHAVATGNFELRPDCLVRELVLDSQGRIRAAIYQDADGNLVEQEAGLFILACGAVETARLMLLSKSGRFPNGLANGSDLVGRNVTFHEYSAAVGTYEDPIYAWAGGGYVSASTFQHYEHDDSRGFVSGGHVAVAGVGIPLPINWHLPGAPGWGAEAKKVDRDNFNHSLAVAMVLHDMPRHDNRVDLDDEVVDAWGLPVARVTLAAHENDLAQGRYLIDRGADILEASGARSVNKVYAQRVTGNCSHQHGTARMGDDPGLSVLNRWCRAHEVENLYAVDGSPFPTGTGANPTLTIMANAWRVADRIIATRGAAA